MANKVRIDWEQFRDDLAEALARYAEHISVPAPTTTAAVLDPGEQRFIERGWITSPSKPRLIGASQIKPTQELAHAISLRHPRDYTLPPSAARSADILPPSAQEIELFLAKQGPLKTHHLDWICEIEWLGLSASDYRQILQADPEPPPTAALRRDDPHPWRLTLAPGKEIVPKHKHLTCVNPQAMRDAFRDRLQRSGIKHIELARKFALKITGNHSCPDIHNFLYEPQSGPQNPEIIFPVRLQDRFWEICAFLNQEIHRREHPAAPLPSTEEFMMQLFMEGTVIHPESQIKNLKRLNDFVQQERRGPAPG